MNLKKNWNNLDSFNKLGWVISILTIIIMIVVIILSGGLQALLGVILFIACIFTCAFLIVNLANYLSKP